MKIFLRMLYVILRNNIELLILYSIHWTPWYRAYVLASWNKYKESDLYRFRWIEFSEVMAAELYTYQDHKLFMYMVKNDKKLMRKILLTPYSILNDVSLDDEYIRSHVVFK